jgi:hypothetical protein
MLKLITKLERGEYLYYRFQIFYLSKLIFNTKEVKERLYSLLI